MDSLGSLPLPEHRTRPNAEGADSAASIRAVQLAVSGPVELARTLETGSSDREANMRAFAEAALTLLLEAVERAG